MNSIIVKAEWDNEASVWVATSEDVPGLAAEAKSLELLRPKVLAMVEDLALEGVVNIGSSGFPVHIIAHSIDKVLGNRAA